MTVLAACGLVGGLWLVLFAVWAWGFRRGVTQAHAECVGMVRELSRRAARAERERDRLVEIAAREVLGG